MSLGLSHRVGLAETQRLARRTGRSMRRSALLADLRAVARPMRRPAVLVGYAYWSAASGDYLLSVGDGSRTIGRGAAVDLLRALERHGYRAGDWWETQTSHGYALGCELFALDWSQAGVR